MSSVKVGDRGKTGLEYLVVMDELKELTWRKCRKLPKRLFDTEGQRIMQWTSYAKANLLDAQGKERKTRLVLARTYLEWAVDVIQSLTGPGLPFTDDYIFNWVSLYWKEIQLTGDIL